LAFACHISSAFDYPQISLSFHFLKCRLSSTTHQLFLLTRVATKPEKDKLFQAMNWFELPLYGLMNQCLDNWIKYLHGKQVNRIMGRKGIYCPLRLKLIKTKRIFSGIIVVSAVYYFDNILLTKKAN